MEFEKKEGRGVSFFFFFFLFKRKLEFLGEMCFSCFSREEEIDVDYTILFFFFF